MLGGVRPSGARRSWWLREALAAEASAAPHLATAAPLLRGTTTADVVVVGGGYTGLWTALRVTELEPGARVVVLEADICGGGPSGRNGGFVTNWWDEFPTLLERYGAVGARQMGEAIEAAVDDVGAFCTTHAVDAWFTKAGSLTVSAAPAQDGAWQSAVEALRAYGLDDKYLPVDAADVAGRVRSPVFRDGVFMPVQYVTGHYDTGTDFAVDKGKGSPAMVQMVPTAQFLDRYAFATGTGYSADYVQVIRLAGGADVKVDNVTVVGYYTVGGYEVADWKISSGGHLAESTQPFGIVGVGYAGVTSYADPGGMKLQVINPQ